MLWSTSNVLSLVTPGETPKRVTGTVAGDWSKSAFRKPLVWCRFQLSDDPVTSRFFSWHMWHVTIPTCLYTPWNQHGPWKIRLWANCLFGIKSIQLLWGSRGRSAFVYTPFKDLPWFGRDLLRRTSQWCLSPYIHQAPPKTLTIVNLTMKTNGELWFQVNGSLDLNGFEWIVFRSSEICCCGVALKICDDHLQLRVERLFKLFKFSLPPIAFTYWSPRLSIFQDRKKTSNL